MSGWLRVRLVLDRVIALVGLLLSAPLIALLVWLVRRHDDGPGVITVPRMGRHGVPFRMWKIRSMRAEHSDGRATGPSLTSAEDRRITPIGQRLRRLHLDELPQLLNVVRGEMALLGPRPEAPDFVDLDDPRWKAVLRVPPGIAGPTQLVVGDWEREQISAAPDGTVYRQVVLPAKLAIDEWYVQSATPQLDLLVMRTLLHPRPPTSGPAALDDVVAAEVPAAAAPVAWTKARHS
jgi:lipopolysaccharide/colanic/teichoic acid biosynthesis glycosyltransferase